MGDHAEPRPRADPGESWLAVEDDRGFLEILHSQADHADDGQTDADLVAGLLGQVHQG